MGGGGGGGEELIRIIFMLGGFHAPTQSQIFCYSAKISPNNVTVYKMAMGVVFLGTKFTAKLIKSRDQIIIINGPYHITINIAKHS